MSIEDNADDVAQGNDRPTLRVVRGEPDAAELAALLAVVVSTAGPAAPEKAAPRGRWSDPAALTRGAWQPGPGGWRAAGR